MSTFRIRTVLVAAMALVPLGAAMITPAADAAAKAGVVHARVVHHPAVHAPVKGGSATTFNWSGYVVPAPAGHQITATHTRLVVPATRTSSPGGAAIWTGVGGWTSSDLIQAGVSVGDLTQGSNYAWYEMLPDFEIPITSGCKGPDPSCAVNTGDTVVVDITNTGGSRWSISLNDLNHWTWQRPFTYASTFSSAEWVLEAPSLVIPMFVPFMDDTSFGPGNTYALDHKSPARKLGTGNPTSVNMAVLGLVPEARPSAMSADGDRFRGCAFKSSCATP